MSDGNNQESKIIGDNHYHSATAVDYGRMNYVNTNILRNDRD